MREELVRLCKDICLQKLCETEDFGQAESYALQTMNSCIIDGLSQALSEFDEMLFSEHEQGLRVKDISSRTIVTAMGPLSVTRRRYVDVERNDTLCLLDAVCDLPERSRVSNGFSEMICSVANASSVRAACALYGFYTGESVSPATVFNCAKRERQLKEAS